MSMHNPPHPGEFITGVYLEPNGFSGRELAEKLGVAPSTLSRVLKGSSRVTPEMALRLSVALGRSPESWLAMQAAYDEMNARLDENEDAELPIDPYAAEDPAEFFAVTSEYFFSAPDLLQAAYPAVYTQLAAFYRQDPATRLARLIDEHPDYRNTTNG